jgi:hypothetical protein
MTGRLFSLIALPLSLLGHLMFWTGSAGLRRTVQTFAPADPAAVILVVAGILLIGAAIATVAVASLGAIVIGALHLAFSLLFFLFPFAPRSGLTPAWDVLLALRTLSPETSDGAFFYVPTGFAFVTGAIFLAAGFAADGRVVVTPSTRARVTFGLSGLLAVAGLLLALAGGGRLAIGILVMRSGPDVLGLILLIVGSVLVGATVLAARWSAAGVFVAGGVIAVAGLIALARPIPVSLAFVEWPELRRAIDIAGSSGVLVLIAALLVLAGLAIRVRARRAGGAVVRTAPADELPPPTGAPSV